MFKLPAINEVARDTGSLKRSDSPQPKGKARVEFTRTLEKALEDKKIKMTNHARERIISRHIRLDEKDVTQISDVMNTLQGKGGKISLLLMGDTTLVTNVKNRTVITALDSYGDANKVFTQIDSAALIDKT